MTSCPRNGFAVAARKVAQQASRRMDVTHRLAAILRDAAQSAAQEPRLKAGHLRKRLHSRLEAGENPDCRLKLKSLVPGDDLALALIIARDIEQIARLAAHQEFRPPRFDRMVAPPPRRGFARGIFRQLRQGKNLAPDLPGHFDLIVIRTDQKRNRQ